MKIAYILYPEALVINKANGIRNQAIAWAKSLNGVCQIDLISTWDEINWSRYDVIHFFGGNQWLGFLPDLKAINPNIVFSPVLDSIEPYWKLKLLASLGVKGYHHPQNMYKLCLSYFKAIYVRSQYEASYFTKCYNVPSERIKYIPIAFELPIREIISKPIKKEKFCLHISALYQERKNIKRLIEASKRYKFPLKLAGSTGNEEQTCQLKQLVEGYDWIELLGYVSNEQAFDLYRKAAVFALPSINEGVGIVALNAAAVGCNVVITSLGGPHEYYNGMAKTVNPYNIDEIGKAILNSLEDGDCPNNQLQQYILEHYSKQSVAKSLLESYQTLNNQTIYP